MLTFVLLGFVAWRSLKGRQMNAGDRRLLACCGGLLAGAVLGAEFIASYGAIKGLLAGIGVALLFAALVPDDPR